MGPTIQSTDTEDCSARFIVRAAMSVAGWQGQRKSCQIVRLSGTTTCFMCLDPSGTSGCRGCGDIVEISSVDLIPAAPKVFLLFTHLVVPSTHHLPGG